MLLMVAIALRVVVTVQQKRLITSGSDAVVWFHADDELAGQAQKKKARTAKGRKEYLPNKGDANWVVVLMLLKVCPAFTASCNTSASA